MRPTSLFLSLILALVALGLAAPALAADTDIEITEIMQNPNVVPDDVGEWFEIHNAGATDVDIQGWTIADLGSNTHTIATGTPIIVSAGAYVVLARNAASMATQGVTALYEYGTSIALANGDDEVILTNALAVEIDRVEWDGGTLWPDPTGASMQWNPAAGDNNTGTAWEAPNTPTFGLGDAGTPGAANAVGAGQAPAVTNVIHRPIVVAPGVSPEVTADVTDSDGDLDFVELYFRVNGGGFLAVPMTPGTGDSFSGFLPTRNLGDLVEYYVRAVDLAGQPATNPSTAPTAVYGYTVQNEVITPIASIHADSLGYAGTIVTVQAQVYIPGNYQANPLSTSAYVQDGSGRGMNIFGSTFSTGVDLLNDTGNIVKISGEVQWFGTTVEIVNYDVSLVSGGNTPLTPVSQTTVNAAAPSNEGTYVQATGQIIAISTTGGTNPAHNFTVDDGSGPLVVRIDDDIDPTITTWALNDIVVAAGAGSTFGGQGQILVGLIGDIENQGAGADVIPPVLLGATVSGTSEVTVSFDEAMDPITAGTLTNYEVFETLTPATTIAVTAATPQIDATKVVLTLASAPSGTVLHTVRVNNVTDLAGNPVAVDSSTPLVDPSALPSLAITEVMQNPDVLLDEVGEWFEVHNTGTAPVDMNGWTIADLEFDSHVINNGGPLVLAPGDYAVFARDAATMALEGVTVFYSYGTDISLGNGADELLLLDGNSITVDEIAWDGGTLWPDPNGASMQWNETGDNSVGANWFFQGPPFGSGDLGTPGAVNDQVTDTPARTRTALAQNAPNPFNPKTSFSFTLDRRDEVQLRVFDARGRRVTSIFEGELEAGNYDNVYSWDGRDGEGRRVTSGVYFFRLETGSGFSQSRSMVLVK